MINQDNRLAERIIKDQNFRKALAGEDFYWFFHIYLPRYITYTTADFQKEIFHLLQDESIQTVAFIAFRGSGKSTIASLAYVLWSMIGKPRKKYILLISQTQELCRQMLTNIRQELEHADLLISDYGPFSEEADEWRANSLVIPQYGTRITAISSNEGIRGLRHKESRPDLVIADDVEDLELVKTKENRDNLWSWLTSEVIPIGDEKTKYVFVGNMLHEDSLMMRLKQVILSRKMRGIYREYPLIDDEHQILWSARFPSQSEIEALKSKIADEDAWCREFLLKIVSNRNTIIHRDDIQYYEELPDLAYYPARLIPIGTDLAISSKDNADFTAFVPAYATGFGKELKVYLLPQVVNKHLSFPETINELKRLESILFLQFKRRSQIYIESVSYQLALSQQLSVEGLFSEAVVIGHSDKRSRLSVISPYVSAKKVLFPKHGAEELINQIVHFGSEKHDDLVDAFTLMMLKIIEGDCPTPGHFSLESGHRRRHRGVDDDYDVTSGPLFGDIMNMKF